MKHTLFTNVPKLMLKQRGYIYDSKHEGWYSVSDETFYPSSAVRLTLDPSTGRKYMVSRKCLVTGLLLTISGIHRNRPRSGMDVGD